MLEAIGYAFATGVVGLLLLILGILALDWATPGHLPTQIAANMNAAAVAGARLVAVGGVAFTTIWTNADKDLLYALTWTFVFGVVGIIMQTIVTLVIGWVWRGSDHVVNTKGPLLPCAVILIAGQFAAALIVIASIA
jgi:hypothetical protein